MSEQGSPSSSSRPTRNPSTGSPSADSRPAAARPSAGRRLSRRTIATVAVVIAVGVGVAIWAGQRSTDPRSAATDAAIRRIADAGGPAGWVPADPVPLLEVGTPTGDRQRHNGIDFTVSSNDDVRTGFIVTWTTTAAPPSAATTCDALVGWAATVVDDPEATPQETADAAASCRAVVAKPPAGETALFTSHGSPPGPTGRYLFAAAATADVAPDVTLYATLTFEAPGD
ncbi:hypothetical protein ACWKSP_01505 [Micromonosporaceae bacterium Da 78-11]